ncbi:MAG: asparagine synthase (glutamine-hydrolyzing) [Brachybacterium sp.]|nr:asparagine synthase (glutamine-hydrolyzing) [Brachybacterium sp.]
MCGIAGTYGFGDQTDQICRRMNDCQAHRGPDGEGIHVAGSAGLAHRRLSIIDREHGDQPMLDDEGTVALVYNGEVYNYLDLRAELEQQGRRFRTVSDTEVVLQAHSAWGTDAYDRFNGMFGFAIHDADSDRLTVVRDHFGIKPVYYWSDESADTGPRVLFASEIKSLLAADVFPAEADDSAVYRYLKHRIHDDGEQTFFRGIRRLLPGQMLQVDADGVRVETFTALQDELRALAAQPGRPYSEEVVSEYRERFEESVRLRLQSEVPVGTSLSGGLDSSAVAAVIARHLREQGEADGYEAVGSRQNTFSAVFPKSINDEEHYVDALLEKYEERITAHKIRPDAQLFLDDLVDFVRTQEEPIISTGPYAQYAVMREASQHVTVLLDGQGADEMMAGYNPYFYVYLRQLRRQRRFGELAREMAASRDIMAKLWRSKFSGRADVGTDAVLNSTFVAENAGTTGHRSPQDDLKARLLDDTFRSSLPSLLRYEDKNTMRFSIEGRVPFVDKELMKFLFSLDESAILHDGWNKRILRESMTGILPDMISRRRNKIGFTTPEREWFHKIAPSLREIFASDSFASRPYFDAPTVLALFDDYVKNPENHGTLLFWRLLNVELWLRAFIDQAPETSAVEEGTAVIQDAAGEAADATPAKSDYAPNPGKELDLTSSYDGRTWRRFPLQTDLVSRDSDLERLVTERVEAFFADLPEDALPPNAPWHFFISEKIVAITQGRSLFTWEITPRRSARLLSRAVTRTPAGIGLGSPYTMELAIREIGLPRIAFAAVVGGAAKLIGKKGVFYQLAGSDVRAIDGPTEYSAFPSNVSAKLPPKDPDAVSARLSAAIRRSDIPAAYRDSFAGTVVMDANDIGRNLLGSDVSGPAARYEETFADNPLGQGRQRTPLAIVADLGGSPSPHTV